MKNTKTPQRTIENLNYIANAEDLPLLINLIQKLEEEDESGYFHTDVDKKNFKNLIKILDYPNYYKEIKNPMNFSLLKKKYFSKKKNWENEIKNFFTDLHLIWSNCWQYNTDNSPISRKAEVLCKIANKFILKNFIGKNASNNKKTDEIHKVDISIKNEKNNINKKPNLKFSSNTIKNEKLTKSLQPQSFENTGVYISNSSRSSNLMVDKVEFKHPPNKKNTNERTNSKAEEDNKTTESVYNCSQINSIKGKELNPVDKKIQCKNANTDAKRNIDSVRKEIKNNKKRIDDCLSEEESKVKTEEVIINNQDLLNVNCKEDINENNNISNNFTNDEITEVKLGEILQIKETCNENEMYLLTQNEKMNNENEVVQTENKENNIEKMNIDTPFEKNQIEVKPIFESLNKQTNINEMIEKTIVSEKDHEQLILEQENSNQKINYQPDDEESKQINKMKEKEEKNCEDKLVENHILNSAKSLEKNENFEDVIIDNVAVTTLNKNTKKPRNIKSIKDKAFDLQDDIFNFSNRLPNKISETYQIRDIITTNHKRERKQVDYKKQNTTKILSNKINEENPIAFPKTLEKKTKFISDIENEEEIKNDLSDNDESKSNLSTESRSKKYQESNRKLNIENNKNENIKEKLTKKTKQKKKNSDVISTFEIDSDNDKKNNIRKTNKIADETLESENVNINTSKKKKRNSLNIKKSARVAKNLKNQNIYNINLNEDFQCSEKEINEDLCSQQEIFIDEMFENISPRVLKYKDIALKDIQRLIYRIRNITNKGTLLDIVTELHENHKECINQSHQYFFINFANFNKKTLKIVNSIIDEAIEQTEGEEDEDEEEDEEEEKTKKFINQKNRKKLKTKKQNLQNIKNKDNNAANINQSFVKKKRERSSSKRVKK